MTQVQEMTPEPTIMVARRTILAPRNVLIGAALLLLVSALTFAYMAFPGSAPSVSTEAAAPAAADGWFPAVHATNQRRLMERASGAVDGWSSVLLPSTPQAFDGWSQRYLTTADD